MAEHQALGDEGIPDDQGRGDEARRQGLAAQQPQHPESGHHRDGQQDCLLQQAPGHDGLDDRDERVLRHRPRQRTADAEGSRQEILARREDKVVAEHEPRRQGRGRHEHRQQRHPAHRQPRVARTTSVPRLHGPLSWHGCRDAVPSSPTPWSSPSPSEWASSWPTPSASSPRALSARSSSASSPRSWASCSSAASSPWASRRWPPAASSTCPMPIGPVLRIESSETA